ncbi:MAG: hypothetical protein IPI02_06520 [Sterolibacteriaceae bacterium]|nr:hypothetical protein [Sterolibacteriaceae bacterium]
MSQQATRPLSFPQSRSSLALEAAAGVLLVAAGLAIRPTTPSRQAYQGFLHLPVSFSAGDFLIDSLLVSGFPNLPECVCSFTAGMGFGHIS